MTFWIHGSHTRTPVRATPGPTCQCYADSPFGPTFTHYRYSQRAPSAAMALISISLPWPLFSAAMALFAISDCLVLTPGKPVRAPVMVAAGVSSIRPLTEDCGPRDNVLGRCGGGDFRRLLVVSGRSLDRVGSESPAGAGRGAESPPSDLEVRAPPLRSLSRRTWWLAVSAVGLGALAVAGGGG